MDFFDFITERKLVILIMSIILNGLLLSVSGYLLWNNLNNNCEINNSENISVSQKEKVISNENYYVDIKGEVKKPGVYEVSNTNIINDVINLAGGFTKKAYTKNINLSKKVSDELVIYVYSESEYKKINEPVQEIIIKECVCPSYEITDCVSNGNSEIISEENNTNTNVSDNESDNNNIKNEEKKLININNATKEELMTLSGIGESKATAIIEYRKQKKFKTIEDIKNVSGIGDSAFEKIKDFITI